MGIYDRGVDLEIVLSQPSSCPGDCNPMMANYGNGWTAVDVASEIIQAIKKARPDAEDERMRQMVRENLRITFLKTSTDADTWPDGAAQGNHAKFFIVDDKAYYLGSQNMYIANLGEWGVIVDSEERTQKILEDYWNPMWQCSWRADTNEVDVDLVMDSMEIQRDGLDVSEADDDTKMAMLKSLRKYYQSDNHKPESTDLAELARRCGLTEEAAASALADEGFEFKVSQYAWVKFGPNADEFELPEGAVKAGETETDGEVYVARNKDGEPGKLNLAGNIWCHHNGEDTKGQVFCVKDEEARLDWVPCKKGDKLPPGAVYAGHTCTDGRVYVARVETGACGKVNVSGGLINNFWVHEGGMQMFGPTGRYEEGEVLCIDEKQTPKGIGCHLAQ